MENTNVIVVADEMKRVVNDAIIKVCTTQFKKDARADHELLEAYGYKIYKSEGHFCVQTRNRTVSIKCVDNYRYMWKVEYGYYYTHQKCFKNLDDLRKFDFVNCLNTPINTVFYQLQERNMGWGLGNDVHAKYDGIRHRLHSLKWDAKYYDAEVDRIQGKIEAMQKQILALQNDMLRYREKAVKSTVELNGLRSELGLA